MFVAVILNARKRRFCNFYKAYNVLSEEHENVVVIHTTKIERPYKVGAAKYVFELIVRAYKGTERIFVGSVEQFIEISLLDGKGESLVRDGFEILKEIGYVNLVLENDSFEPTQIFLEELGYHDKHF